MFFVWLAMFVLGLILVVKGPRLVGLLMCSPYLTPIILINLLASPDNYDSVEYWCSIISWVMAIVAMLYVVFRLVASTPAATLVASIPVATDEDQQMVNTLIELASYYASGGLSRDNPQLVDEAMQIGRHLNDRGGKNEMLRIFHMIPAMQGKRTVEMTWDGIGDWRG